LIVTDGEDNTSRNSWKTVREIQKTDTVIYTIGLPGQEKKKRQNAESANRYSKRVRVASLSFRKSRRRSLSANR
jgi:hypothetical protein